MKPAKRGSMSDHWVTLWAFLGVLSIFLVSQISPSSSLMFDDHKTTATSNLDEDDDFYHHRPQPHKHEGPMPKDKLLFRDVESLTFLRNRRTTSKLTHSIPQLSCVGGSAGCKLFTVNEVVCENTGFDADKGKPTWSCKADLGDRVQLKPVDIICEGYEYPEDDYILKGSCGLEFTLDYSDPNDYHHHSYYKHMDEHEKNMHRERLGATDRPSMAQQAKQPYHWAATYRNFLLTLVGQPSMLWLCFGLISILVILVLAARAWSQKYTVPNRSSKGSPNKYRQATLSSRMSSYGPLASAVLTTKKTC